MAETPNLTAISTSFNEFGGKIFRKNINSWNLSNKGILVYKNVKAPLALPRVSATSGVRPYRAQDDTNDAVGVDDRILTVYQSKWDYDIDPEKFRNTYLAKFKPGTAAFADWINQVVAEEYLASLNDSTTYLGVRNGSGTNAAAVADGWGTIIAAAITATDLTPVTTTAITTAALAGSEIAKVVAAVPVWMREKGYRVKCSYTTFDFYAAWYASTFGFQFNPDATGRYRINNQNAFLEPESWMGTSQRIIATIDDNLCLGTDGDKVAVAASVRRNIIEARAMMPVGYQIADLDALVVNSNA